MPIRFRDFAIDFDRLEVSDRSGPLHLTPKALELLRILVENRPKVISRSELYDRLWPDTFVQATNVHNLVRELRTALGDREHEIIRTKYGVGFSFGADAFLDDPPVPVWQMIVNDQHHQLHQGENLIGRDPSATVRIEARSVSRLHARIVIGLKGATIQDLDSKNGTFLQGRRLRAAVALRDGDEVIFGSVHARVRLLENVESTTTLEK
jgi:DNA-binding winged helix-turn-helix (wHTH) protein